MKADIDEDIELIDIYVKPKPTSSITIKVKIISVENCIPKISI